MKLLGVLYLSIFIACSCITLIGNTGCAQIGSIAGGAKDTLPPKLLSANPPLLSPHFTDNKITLTFDEYVDVQEVQANILMSPYPKINPEVKSKLKTVTIKLKDTLLPNTTYAIHFGKAIRDINEGNVFNNFTYVFSTGNTIDSLNLSGKVQLAETGKTDSTLLVLLYRNANDSSVQKIKPNYIATVNGEGHFMFTNLAPGTYNIYALKDGDGSKTYNSKTEAFAFLDTSITVAQNNLPINLLAYVQEKSVKTLTGTASTAKPKTPAQKKLKYTLSAIEQKQDLRKNLIIEFSNPIKKLDSTKIILTDTNFLPIAGALFLVDSNKIIIQNKWTEDAQYKLIIQKNAVVDKTDSTLAKTDTLKFKTKAETEYGNIVLRFANINLTKHPVIQFTQQDEIKESYPITGKEWQNKLFPPGEYELRILYDENNNGKWDPGNYSKKIQPEKVIALPKKITIKENWDNESDINL